ncbi:hypothetical protein KKH15_02150 [Patescibacteria group bacterium]|nr:hypothetical protein [Patescibacteria group bacterium]MBU1754907.1 hypothetical protein [Patescibacteria group bacterium]
MKIPEKLSQFTTTTSLLLVSGKQEMVMYIVQNGEIEVAKHISIPNPTYSDNEGHFKVRSGGDVLRSGSVRETDDREIIVKFMNETESALSELTEDIDQVYLSAPTTTKNEILHILSPQLAEKLVKTVDGNFCSATPIEVLELFTEEEESSAPTTVEAQKILDKSNQAREVIPGTPD